MRKDLDTGACVLVVGSVALFSTGHWIGASVILVLLLIVNGKG